MELQARVEAKLQRVWFAVCQLAVAEGEAFDIRGGRYRLAHLIAPGAWQQELGHARQWLQSRAGEIAVYIAAFDVPDTSAAKRVQHLISASGWAFVWASSLDWATLTPACSGWVGLALRLTLKGGLSNINSVVLLLYSLGITTRDIGAHLAGVCIG